VYIFGDDELTVAVCSQSLSDLLNLTGSDISEGCKDDLLVATEQFVQLLNSLFFLLSSLSTASHSIYY
jgi:hypothetical protein